MTMAFNLESGVGEEERHVRRRELAKPRRK
jgi:hypothetical protein